MLWQQRMTMMMVNTKQKSYDYQIQSGDTLTQIARRANMTIKQLLKLNEDNPAIKTKDLIYAGGNIKLSRPVKTKEDIINFDTKPPAILTKESNGQNATCECLKSTICLLE